MTENDTPKSGATRPRSEQAESSADQAERPESGAPQTATKPPPGAADAKGRAAMQRSDEQLSERRQSLSRWLVVGLALAVIIIVALAATLRLQQQQLDDFGREASRRIDEAASHAESARQQAQQAQEVAQGVVQNVDRRLTDLDQRTRRTEEQQQSLDRAWRELVVGEEETLLVSVEQSLLMAAEQLQLAGRVPAAIAALQLAESRLARASRPAHQPLQQAIAKDLKALQALPFNDFDEVSRQIDRMLQDVAQLPLKAPGLGPEVSEAASESTARVSRPAVSAPPASTPVPADPGTTDEDWWRQAWVNSQVWAERARDSAVTELRRLVEVRRVDDPQAMLLSAEQAELLRANLSLRLIEARMALLARVNPLWVSDLAEVRSAIERYAEPDSAVTRRLLRDLAALQEIEPAPELPRLSESLRAVRSLISSVESRSVPAQASPASGD